MSISTIKIKHFKSIVDVSLDLGKLNVFIGTNGSGKSNLLEAIAMLSCAVDSRIDYSKLAERGARLSAPEVFKSSFKNQKRKNNFSLEAIFEHMEYHVGINAKSLDGDADFTFYTETLFRDTIKLVGRNNAGLNIHNVETNVNSHLKSRIRPQQGIIQTLESLGKLEDIELSELERIKQYAIYSLSTPILRGISPDTSNKEPLGLYGGSLATALNDVVQEFIKHKDIFRFFNLFDWFNKLGTTAEISDELQSKHIHTGKKVVNFTDKYMSEKFNQLYAYDVSEGALYVLFVLVLLLHKKSPSFFAVDNIDSALNPSMITTLMSHINEILETQENKQILITTHNPTALDSIDLFNNNHRLFVVQRNNKGHTTIERIMPPKGFTRDAWIEKHGAMKLSEIWLSGIIGGLAKGF